MPRMKPVEPHGAHLKEIERALRSKKLSPEDRVIANRLRNALHTLAFNRGEQPASEKELSEAKAAWAARHRS